MRINKSRAMIWASVAAIVAMSSGVLNAQESKKDEKKWYDTLQLKGDVRVRYERIDEDGKDVRNRGRIRARLEAGAKANEDIDVGIGIATGAKDDPVSRNQTLTGGFGPKDFLLDLAYVDWHPKQVEGLSLHGGKMKNPFVAVSDIIWDGDVTPEGAALKYALGEAWKAQVVGSAFSVEERSADDDTMLYGGQVSLQGSIVTGVSVLVGTSYYQFSHIKGFAVLDPANKQSSYGNSAVSVVEDGKTNKYYTYEYELVEPFVEITLADPLPISLFANYVRNTDPDDNNTGYAAGLKFGKAKNLGTAEVGYMYKKVEKDATFGLLTDSDAWGGGTDGKSHRITAAYQIDKNWQAGVTYFLSVKGIDKDVDYNRLQLDLVAKF